MNRVIPAFDPQLHAELQAAIDQKTKPLGSLGSLEALALQIGLIQNTLQPCLQRPAMIVFAGDHGIAQAGVSAYPQVVTTQMVMNFLSGGAAINVFCRQQGFTLEVVNAGIDGDLPEVSHFINQPVARGTRNFLEAPAMTAAQLKQAMQTGAERVIFHAEQGSNVIAFGEMGIANTSSASCLMQRFTGLELSQCVGRGTGLDDPALARKLALLTQALAKHAHAPSDPENLLATFGGFEIAMLCGAFLEAASRRMVVLVDGFIVSAALLAAQAMAPQVLDYCVFAHCSDESGHRAMLNHLGATGRRQPLLQLGLRLGEGSGAALAYPLLVSAVGFLNEMASFSSAGVSHAT